MSGAARGVVYVVGTQPVSGRYLATAPEDSGELSMLGGLGVPALGRAAFLARALLPRLGSLPPPLRDACVLGLLLGELPALAREDARFVEGLSALPCVPVDTGGGGGGGGGGGSQPAPAATSAGAHGAAAGAGAPPRLAAPRDLHDPTVAEMRPLLDVASFPAPGPFCAPDALAALRALGLRARVSRGVVRASAESVARQRDVAAAVARGGALLGCALCARARVGDVRPPCPRAPLGARAPFAHSMYCVALHARAHVLCRAQVHRRARDRTVSARFSRSRRRRRRRPRLSDGSRAGTARQRAPLAV